MMIRSLSAFACLSAVLFSGAAGADGVTVSLPLDLGADGAVTTVQYQCGEAERAVTYINTATTGLALLNIDGQPLVFVNVVSASGARYVSGAYEWWSKGNEARLESVAADGAETCTEIAAAQ